MHFSEISFSNNLETLKFKNFPFWAYYIGTSHGITKQANSFLDSNFEKLATANLSAHDQRLYIHLWFVEFGCLVHDIQCAPPPPFYWGVLPPTKFSKREGLTRHQLLDGGCWERWGDFFQGGCNFYIKNKLKSEIFNDKKKFININIFCHN